MSTHEQEVADRLAKRSWPARPIRPGVTLSFEYFPTTTTKGAESLDQTVQALDALAPAFTSVTYGAGGSTQDRTLDTIQRVREASTSPVAGHLTCVGASRPDVLGLVDHYVATGVTHIVALRGDAPESGGPSPSAAGFADAAELVAGIRAHVGGEVEISVAAYPEVHPRARSANADLDNLKRKIDAGADRAITQFFFDTDAYLYFLDDARATGITVPIVPGIMPITNFERVSSFAERCGTSIPEWMPELFGGLEEAPEIHQMIAATVAAEQCRVLAEHGVVDFHFYTMNQAALTQAVCRILGVAGRRLASEAQAAS